MSTWLLHIATILAIIGVLGGVPQIVEWLKKLREDLEVSR